MRNFATQLIVVASLSAGIMAQLPRECFFVTKMHGPNPHEGDLISNLPTLENMYKPGMHIKSITSLLDHAEGGRMTGLQVDLLSDSKHQLHLPIVGVEQAEWESKKKYFKSVQPDKISILTDKKLGGICEIVIYQGKSVTFLSGNDDACNSEDEGITETEIRLPEETPLVGFHGRSDGDVLNSLGLILLNRDDPACQQPLHGNFQMYTGSIFEQSEAAENAITYQEHAKTHALEAIIAYNTIAKARESKLQIQKEIKQLNAKMQLNAKVPTGERTPQDAEQNSDRLDSLFKEMKDFEEVEDQSREYLEEEYDMQGEEIDDILKAIKHDSSRLDQMQKILLDLERSEKHNNPPHILKEQASNSGAVFNKIAHILDENDSIAKKVMIESENITEAERKIEEESSNMVYVVMATVFISIIIGMLIGIGFVFACLKNYKGNQQKRLEQSGHQNLRFVGGERDIDMPTQVEQKMSVTNENEDSIEAQGIDEEESGAQKVDTEDIRIDEIKKSQNNKTVAIPEPLLRTLADDNETDFVNVLTARGLIYDTPNERRATIKAPRKAL